MKNYITRNDKNIFCRIFLVSSIACQITADCSKQNFKRIGEVWILKRLCKRHLCYREPFLTLLWLKCETNSFPYGSTFHTFELANRILKQQTYILHKAFFYQTLLYTAQLKTCCINRHVVPLFWNPGWIRGHAVLPTKNTCLIVDMWSYPVL